MGSAQLLVGLISLLVSIAVGLAVALAVGHGILGDLGAWLNANQNAFG